MTHRVLREKTVIVIFFTFHFQKQFANISILSRSIEQPQYGARVWHRFTLDAFVLFPNSQSPLP